MAKTNLSLPDKLMTEGRAYAKKTGRFFNGLVEVALKEYMEAHK